MGNNNSTKGESLKRTETPIFNSANVGAGQFRLSNDCSQIAVAAGRKVSLYDIKTQEILNECTMEDMDEGDIWDIRFSPDGRQLWLLLNRRFGGPYCTTLHTTKDWRSPEVTEGLLEKTEGLLEDGWSLDSRFPPPGYRTRVGSGWVEGPGGRRLLWLPPNWRTGHMTEAVWDGNFLALVDERHPEPIIIEFRSQPLLPCSCPTHSSNA